VIVAYLGGSSFRHCLSGINIWTEVRLAAFQEGMCFMALDYFVNVLQSALSWEIVGKGCTDD
jgi:hypothetical protein